MWPLVRPLEREVNESRVCLRQMDTGLAEVLQLTKTSHGPVQTMVGLMASIQTPCSPLLLSLPSLLPLTEPLLPPTSQSNFIVLPNILYSVLSDSFSIKL